MAANADPIAKVREMDASAVDAKEVLKMATVNGAKAMRLNRADVLAKGKYADLIMIDLHRLTCSPSIIFQRIWSTVAANLMSA